MAKKDSKTYAKAQRALQSVMNKTTWSEAYSANRHTVYGGGVVGAGVGFVASRAGWTLLAPDMIGSPEHIVTEVVTTLGGASAGAYLSLYLVRCSMDEAKAQAFHSFLLEAGVSEKTIMRVLEDDSIVHPKAYLARLAVISTNKKAGIRKKREHNEEEEELY